MKFNHFALLFLLFFIPSLACGSFTSRSVVGSGDLINQTIDISEFDRVRLEGFGNVYIEQGEVESLSVQTDNNIIPLLDIKVSAGELILGIQQGLDVTPSQSITYNLTVQDLKSVTLAGSGDFYVEPVNSDKLTVSIPGSGDIDIKGLTGNALSIDMDGSGNVTLQNIDIESLDTFIQGSGDVKLEGSAKTQKVTVNGSGNYLAGNLETDTANVDVTGSADVTVWVNDELNVHINGSGDIQYYGDPNIAQSGTGSGEITSLGDK